MIYLASPYAHPDASVRESRYRAACLATAKLLRAGLPVFSPIAHSHALVAHGLPIEWLFWQRFDRTYLERSDFVVVLMLEGWKTSVGVQAEIGIARELGKPVFYHEAETPDSLPTFDHDATAGQR
jgi:nucleoside 2-deoxyribosyltransferase